MCAAPPKALKVDVVLLLKNQAMLFESGTEADLPNTAVIKQGVAIPESSPSI